MTSSRSQTSVQVVSGPTRVSECRSLAPLPGWLLRWYAMNRALRRLMSGKFLDFYDFCAFYKVTVMVKVKVSTSTLATVPLTWVRLVTSSALQSQKWQLIDMSQWCRSALCGHPLPVLTDSWTHGAASRHTTAQWTHHNLQLSTTKS